MVKDSYIEIHPIQVSRLYIYVERSEVERWLHRLPCALVTNPLYISILSSHSKHLQKAPLIYLWMIHLGSFEDTISFYGI